MKTLRIEINKEDFFVKYLIVVNSILNLGDQQLRIFAYLLYINDKHRNLPLEERERLLFSPNTKKQLQKKVNISKASLENYFTKLRNKGFIKGRIINPVYDISYEEHKDLLFSFRLKEDEG